MQPSLFGPKPPLRRKSWGMNFMVSYALHQLRGPAWHWQESSTFLSVFRGSLVSILVAVQEPTSSEFRLVVGNASVQSPYHESTHMSDGAAISRSTTLAAISLTSRVQRQDAPFCMMLGRSVLQAERCLRFFFRASLRVLWRCCPFTVVCIARYDAMSQFCLLTPSEIHTALPQG
jgi:hypothetical protein